MARTITEILAAMSGQQYSSMAVALAGAQAQIELVTEENQQLKIALAGLRKELDAIPAAKKTKVK